MGGGGGGGSVHMWKLGGAADMGRIFNNLHIHESQIKIFLQNFCTFGILMGCKLPSFAQFQQFWYTIKLGHKFANFCPCPPPPQNMIEVD